MKTLLIVADDPATARALGDEFSSLEPGLTVLKASGTGEARELLSERAVDLILADLDGAEAPCYELASWTTSHCPDTSFFVMSRPNGTSSVAAVASSGIVTCFTKPVDARAALQRFGETISQSVRGFVQNVSLASLLQLLEMERKTCHLTVSCADQRGELTVRAGVLVHARCADVTGEAAAIAIVAWPNPAVTIAHSCDAAPATIERSLGFIVMEAMRVQDEAARANSQGSDGRGSNWPPPEHRTWRPTGAPLFGSLPPPSERARRLNGDFSPSSGATLLAVVDVTTGAVLQYAAAHGSPVNELAHNASQVLQHEIATLRLCDAGSLEELVLSTTTRCDVIRPLSANEFALLVFVPQETNLVMARLELEQFIACAAAQRTP